MSSTLHKQIFLTKTWSDVNALLQVCVHEEAQGVVSPGEGEPGEKDEERESRRGIPDVFL